MGGTHIDVTTLQRNAYFFGKMQDLPSKIMSTLAKSRINPSLSPGMRNKMYGCPKENANLLADLFPVIWEAKSWRAPFELI